MHRIWTICTIIALRLSIFNAFQSSYAYNCPAVGKGPNEISVGRNVGGSTTVSIVRSAVGTLCTLTRMTPLTNNLNSLKAQDWEVVPVARSYQKNPWENVAGPYVLGINITCNVSTCSIKIKHLDDVMSNSKFVLTTSKRVMTAKEMVARFLEQATFGPTYEGIMSFDLSVASLPFQFASWVEKQMNPDLVSPTYHREFFRRRVDNFLDQGRSTDVVRPRHPCTLNSRWRKHSFVSADYGSTLSVSRATNGFLLSVDGIPRTVIQSFKDTNGKNLNLGSYQFCWWTMEYVGGTMSIYPIGGVSCVELAGGNPPINLPQDIIDPFQKVIRTINLPPKDQFTVVEKVLYGFVGEKFFGGAGLISGAVPSDPICDEIPQGDFGMNLIGVFPDGKQWYYDARIFLDENTVENPVFDGGGESQSAGTLCSNVPKNFLNLDHCFLTTEPTACSPVKTNPTVFLDETTNRLLYHGSGRYVYTIRQLPMTQVKSPCTPAMMHRWMRIDDSTCVTSGVSTATKNALSAMITDWVRDQMNKVLLDIHLEWTDYVGVYNGHTCNSSNSATIGMKVKVATECYRHVHPDEGNIYDFTYWTLPNTHPGNSIAESSGKPNPITKWADSSDRFILYFPSFHTIDRWENSKINFDYIGRSNDYIAYLDLPTKLRTKQVAASFDPPGAKLEAIVVCGSPGEVANDPSYTNGFSFVNDGSPKDIQDMSLQKANVWNTIALSGQDELRQRMAWALSQILVVTPNQINEDGLSEAYLNYYDIFVRNAFGNYRDILKEVSYSPMMAEMLSFLESKSSAYVLRTQNVRARPDENFAREVMQLFSIGVHQLNIDGTPILSTDSELPIPTYDNSDIQVFARAWTGFLQQPQRANIENWDWYPNRIDPMDINPRWRDVFPKRNLYDGYIGDSYPLCADLPRQQFLSIGAKYILLGSSSFPEYQSGDDGWTEPWWVMDGGQLVRLSLDPSSFLFRALCDPNPDGICNFKPVVTLTETLNCQGIECGLDNVRTIRVSIDPPVYYEYIRPACVELTFFNNGKKVRKNQWDPLHEVMCANTAVDHAHEACCYDCGSWGCTASVFCNFSGERVRYSTADGRCKNNNQFSGGYICDWTEINELYSNTACTEWVRDDNWHWTNQLCSIKAKVDELGKVAIVHDPKSGDTVFPDYAANNENYFPVTWDQSAFPSNNNGCDGVCVAMNGSCLCDLTVVESTIFTSIPKVSDVLNQLSIGSVPPSWYGATYSLTESLDGVDVYQRNGLSYERATIFGVVVSGETRYFRNRRSTVVIGNGAKTFRFRNPPHFMNFMIPDVRDVTHETEAVLDHYFFHNNMAPFLARKIIQRFGISNPSPRYVKAAATAFKTGRYTSQGIVFGDSKYGNLGAMLAAILLDREARNVVLETDPSFGSLREPVIKLLAFMRAMKFETRHDVHELALVDLSTSIGQMPHAIPNVFSFFLPDYSPPGPIKDATLLSPEAQVQTSPTFVSFLNGIISLVDLGLTKCFGGLGQVTAWDCPSYEFFNKEEYSEGFLHYVPQSTTTKAIVNELALLLTSGRLSSQSRALITTLMTQAPTLHDGIRIAQKVIAASPEFHSTNVVTSLLQKRPDMSTPEPSNVPYKAVVFVLLEGGMDSYNILVPHSGCEGKDLYAEYKSVRGALALDQDDILQIDASSSFQPCSTFGVHPELSVVKQLYNDGDLSFFANTGVLQEYVDKTDWWSKTTETALFAHNTQQEEVSFVDVFDIKAGFGVCGRMSDLVRTLGFKAGTLSVNGVAEALVSRSTPMIVVDPNGIEKVNPIPWSEDIISTVKLLNKSNKVGSSLFGETWSDLLFRALGENQLLYDAFADTQLSVEFPDTWLSYQFQAVAKLISTKDVRGTDRDAFYVEMGGFDTHSDMIIELADRASEVNEALGAFTEEMKAQGRWNDVVVVFVSEFARTLTPNTSDGSDHAWGGNYFAAGGSINGGKIFGQYITDFTEDSPINFNPGVTIPTTSWDQVWEPIANWYGITTEEGLDDVIPNRHKFAGPLDDLF